MTEAIPLNRPFISGKELAYMSQCLENGQISGDGPFSKRCERNIGELIDARHVLLTTSSSSALRIATLLCNLVPGDEVIMPAYCGAAEANAFLAVGAKLVFVDIDPDTLNIDMAQVETSLTNRTRVILPHHFSGVACDMDRLLELSNSRKIRVIEDVTEGFRTRYRDKALGTLGDIGVFSFLESKDLRCSSVGALVINDPTLYERAHIIRDKGTNRRKFLRGVVDKYTWVDLGSSHTPSDLLAAFLAAQLEKSKEIEEHQRFLHERYTETLSSLAQRGLIRFQATTPDCQSMHHSFCILLQSERHRNALLGHLRNQGISAAVHFSPLHQSVMGRKHGYGSARLPITVQVSQCILRLPFYHDLCANQVLRVAQAIEDFFQKPVKSTLWY